MNKPVSLSTGVVLDQSDKSGNNYTSCSKDHVPYQTPESRRLSIPIAMVPFMVLKIRENQPRRVEKKLFNLLDFNHSVVGDKTRN